MNDLRPSELGRRIERLLQMHGTPRLAVSRLLSLTIAFALFTSVASVVALAQVDPQREVQRENELGQQDEQRAAKPPQKPADNGVDPKDVPAKQEAEQQAQEKKRVIQQDDSLEMLIEALTSIDFSTRIRAVDFLGYRGAKAKEAVPALIKTLDDYHQRESTLHALKAIGPSASKAIPALYKSFTAYPKQPATPYLAADALAHIGEASLPTVYKGIKSENLYERIWSHAVIAKIQGPESSHLNALAKLMNSSDKKTSLIAVEALTMIGPKAKSVIPQIIEAMDNPVSPKTDLAVLLSRFGKDSRPAIPHLVKLLDHENDMTQQRSAYALSTIGGEEILPAAPGLIRMLAAKRGFVREMAAKTLGEIGPKANKAIDPLIEGLSDEDEHARAAAAAALANVGPNKARVHRALAKAMSDPSGRVRSSVAIALAPHAPLTREMIEVFVKASKDNWRGVTQGCEVFFQRLGPEQKKFIPEGFRPGGQARVRG